MNEPTRCNATTRSGSRCSNTAGPNGFCWIPAHNPDIERDDSLNPRQQRFVEEYAIDLNATRAAERAGYTGNYSTLSSVAHKLLKHADVAKAVNERLEAMAMSAEEATARMATWARGSVDPFIVGYDDEGRPKIDLSTPEAKANLHLIKEIKYDRHGNMVIKLHDATAATKTLMQVHGKLIERHEHRHRVELRDHLDEVDDLSPEEAQRLYRESLG